MIFFAFVALLLIGTALFFTLRPLMGVAISTSLADERAARWQVLYDQRNELEADLKAGTLNPADAEEARAEWAANAAASLHEATLVRTEGATALPSSTRATAVVAVLLMTVGLYAWLGAPDGLEVVGATLASTHSRPAGSLPSGQAPHAETPQAMKEMVRSLETKLAANADNPAGWALLARTRGRLGDFAGAAEAYAQALQRAPDNPDLLSDRADVLAMAANRQLRGAPAALVARALEVDPRHPKALALAATAAMQAGDTRAALGYWQRLRDTLPPDAADVRDVEATIAQLSAALTAPPRRSASSAPDSLGGVSGGTAGSVAARLMGRIELAPELQSRLKPGAVLFVLARAQGEGLMPLAVRRLPANNFPVDFMLDDSMAMAPQARLSGAMRVEVEARVSFSGQTSARPGDLRGVVRDVAPSADGLRVVIDSVLP